MEDTAETHSDCRVHEFARWPRFLLEHERAFLSRAMAEGGALMSKDERSGIMHDLSDIDFFLAQLPLGGNT